jgi:hypothetical protein
MIAPNTNSFYGIMQPINPATQVMRNDILDPVVTIDAPQIAGVNDALNVLSFVNLLFPGK